MRARNIIISIGILLSVSCGQQYDAEQTVKAFVEENMEEGVQITDRDFADLGQTRHINDSLIALMHQRGAPLFKQGITYPTASQDELFYLRMRYVHDGDTLQNTFYLNQELTEVVAFK